MDTERARLNGDDGDVDSRAVLSLAYARALQLHDPLIVITVGYALFQTANNTAGMTDTRPEQRGVVSGLLNRSRNLGLITEASVMDAVFAAAASTIDIATTPPDAVATGMRTTFAGAAVLLLVALAVAVVPGSRPNSTASGRRTVRLAGVRERSRPSIE